MGKKGRQGGTRKQPNPRKIQRSEAATKEKPPIPEAESQGDARSAPKHGTAESTADHDLGQILGLQNLGHTCFFNAAVQVSDHIVSKYSQIPASITMQLSAAQYTMACS